MNTPEKSPLLTDIAGRYSMVQASSPPMMAGWLSKKARSGLFRTWQKRYVILESGIIRYFEDFDEESKLPLKFKGSFSLLNAKTTKTEYQICLHSGTDGESDLIFHADSEAFAITWKKAIDEHIEFSNSSSSTKEHELVQMDISETGDEPPEMQGMMLTTRGKRHVIKSWVLRYVVLSEGMLLLYEDYDEENEEPGTRHGVMVLSNATISTNTSGSDEIHIYPGPGEEDTHLHLTSTDKILEGNKKLDRWKWALKDHIAYASKYEFVIRKKLEAISNRVATNRLGFYGYTTTGMIQNVKKKLMQKVKDEAAHELRARLERAIIFVKTNPLDINTLSYVNAVLLVSYGLITLIINILSLDVIRAALSLNILYAGIVFISLEYRFNMIPRRFIIFAFTSFAVLFTPYGRIFTHMFYAVLIISQSSLVAGLFIYETYLLGLFLFGAACFMFYCTWKSRKTLHDFKMKNFSNEELKFAFNDADSSKNGELSKSEFCKMAHAKFNFELSNNDLNVAMLELDRDLNNEVSWEEFILWYRYHKRLLI